MDTLFLTFNPKPREIGECEKDINDFLALNGVEFDNKADLQSKIDDIKQRDFQNDIWIIDAVAFVNKLNTDVINTRYYAVVFVK